MSTEQTKQQHATVRTFLKNASTRNGHKPTFDTVDFDRNGLVSTVQGSVNIDGNVTRCVWNFNGTNLGGNPELDLVTKQPAAEFLT